MDRHPTHFLSLRCAGAVETLAKLQAAFIQFDPRLESLCQACPVQRAHLSLLMLYLPNPDILQSESSGQWERGHRLHAYARAGTYALCIIERPWAAPQAHSKAHGSAPPFWGM